MVVSKRCKICTIIDENNVPIAGEYFGKQIPEIIFKISGVEIDPRKANDVLICQSCVIQLVHTDVVIDKLKNAVQRLKKNVRETKLKTPAKKAVDPNKSTENAEQQAAKLDGNKSKPVKDSGAVTEKSSSTPKKIVRRKSVFVDKLPDAIDGSKQNGKIVSAEKVIKKSPAAKRKPISPITETDNNLFLANASNNTTIGKRSKTISTGEESPMDLTVDEQDANDTNNKNCVEEVQEKARNCILCDKIFHSKRTLRDHIETAHMGERLKACPHCSCEFRSLQKYESHVFSEKCKSSNHPCQHPNCSKRFKTVHKMELHMQQKHSSQNESKCE